MPVLNKFEDRFGNNTGMITKCASMMAGRDCVHRYSIMKNMISADLTGLGSWILSDRSGGNNIP